MSEKTGHRRIKACRKCGVELVSGENWSGGAERKRFNICRACDSARFTAWARNNPDKAREASRRHANKGAAPRVYVLAHPELNGCKVGLTVRNPSRRLYSYNTGCPDRGFYYAALVEVVDAKAAEAQLHETLDRFRVGTTEWVRGIPLEAVIRLVQSLAVKEGSPDGNQ